MASVNTREFGWNQNTHCGSRDVLRRVYLTPRAHGMTMPKAKGIRQAGTATIFTYYAPTPEKGSGDPRIAGTRIIGRQNHYTITG